jgi:hypothetical protein
MASCNTVRGVAANQEDRLNLVKFQNMCDARFQDHHSNHCPRGSVAQKEGTRKLDEDELNETQTRW